jgi:hypothetical protein
MSFWDDITNWFSEVGKRAQENADKVDQVSSNVASSISQPTAYVPKTDTSSLPQSITNVTTTSTGDHPYQNDLYSAEAPAYTAQREKAKNVYDSTLDAIHNAVNAVGNTASNIGNDFVRNAKKNVQDTDNAISSSVKYSDTPNNAPYVTTTTTGDHSTDDTYKAVGAGLKAISQGKNVSEAMQKETAETLPETLTRAQEKINKANLENAQYTETVNNNTITKGASDLLRSNLAGVSSAVNGTVAGVANAGRTVSHVLGNDELADKFGGIASDADDTDVQTGLNQNNQFAGTVVGDLASTIGQMLPQTILGVATGGTAAAGKIGLGLMGASVYGNESNKAFNQLGADGNLSNEDYLRANLYAGAKAGTEVATENIDNVLPGMKMGLNQFLEEGLEEGVGALVDPLTDQILDAKNLKDAATNVANSYSSMSYWKDLAKQAGLGTLSAVVSSAPHLLDKNYRNALIEETENAGAVLSQKIELKTIQATISANKAGLVSNGQKAAAVDNLRQIAYGENGSQGLFTSLDDEGNIANPLKSENGDIKTLAQQTNYTLIQSELEGKLGSDAAKTIAKIANKMETPIIFDDSPFTLNDGTEVDGCVNTNGVICINKNASDPVSSIFEHELAHMTENSENHGDYVAQITEMFKNGEIKDENNLIGKIQSDNSLSADAKKNESVAILTQSLLNDQESLKTLAGNSSSVAKYLIDSMKNYATGKSNTLNIAINTLRKSLNTASAPNETEAYTNLSRQMLDARLYRMDKNVEQVKVSKNILSKYDDYQDALKSGASKKEIKSKHDALYDAIGKAVSGSDKPMEETSKEIMDFLAKRYAKDNDAEAIVEQKKKKRTVKKTTEAVQETTENTSADTVNKLSDYLTQAGIKKSAASEYAQNLVEQYPIFQNDVQSKTKNPKNTFMKEMAQVRAFAERKNLNFSDISKNVFSIIKDQQNTDVAPAKVETQPEPVKQTGIFDEPANVQEVKTEAVKAEVKPITPDVKEPVQEIKTVEEEKPVIDEALKSAIDTKGNIIQQNNRTEQETNRAIAQKISDGAKAEVKKSIEYQVFKTAEEAVTKDVKETVSDTAKEDMAAEVKNTVKAAKKKVKKSVKSSMADDLTKNISESMKEHNNSKLTENDSKIIDDSVDTNSKVIEDEVNKQREADTKTENHKVDLTNIKYDQTDGRSKLNHQFATLKNLEKLDITPELRKKLQADFESGQPNTYASTQTNEMKLRTAGEKLKKNGLNYWYNYLTNKCDVTDKGTYSLHDVNEGDLIMAQEVNKSVSNKVSDYGNSLVTLTQDAIRNVQKDGKLDKIDADKITTVKKAEDFLDNHTEVTNGNIQATRSMLNDNRYLHQNVTQMVLSMRSFAGSMLHDAQVYKNNAWESMTGDEKADYMRQTLDDVNDYIVTKTREGKKFLQTHSDSDYLASLHTGADKDIYENLISAMADATDAHDSETYAEKYEEFKKLVQHDAPRSATEKLRSWRYLNMLVAPVTHERNILGNALMSAMNASKNANQFLVESMVKHGGLVMTHNINHLKDDTEYMSSKDQKKYLDAMEKAGITEEDITDHHGYFDNRNNAMSKAFEKYLSSHTGKADTSIARKKYFSDLGYTGEALDSLVSNKSRKFAINDRNMVYLRNRTHTSYENALLNGIADGSVSGKFKKNNNSNVLTGFTYSNENDFANKVFNDASKQFIDESALRMSKANRAQKKQAKEYIQYLEETGSMKMGEKYGDENVQEILQGRTPFAGDNIVSKAINSLYNFNSYGFKSAKNVPVVKYLGLENEDKGFYESNAATALAMDLNNKGYSLEKTEDGSWRLSGLSKEKSDSVLNDLVANAKQVGEESVYRDSNAFVTQLNKMRKNSKIANLVLEASVPFIKTPSNIIRRGIEYSPVSFISAKALKSKVIHGDISGDAYISRISKGMSGSEIAMAGLGLAMAGVLKGKDRDDDYNAQNYKSSTFGNQDYALNIGGHQIDLSWGAPVTSVLLTGAAVADALKDKGDFFTNGEWASVGADVLDSYWSVIEDTSMLSGLKNTLKTFAGTSSKNGKASDVAVSLLGNIVSQALPVAGKQIGNIIDDTQRVTYSSDLVEEMKIKALQTLAQSYKLQPKLDSHGNEIKKDDLGMGAFGRAVNTLANPIKVTEDNHTRQDEEILKLYNTTKDDSLLGRTIDTLNINGSDVSLKATDKTTTDVNKAYKSVLYNELGNYLSSDSYKTADDDTKNTVVSAIKSYAMAQAKKAYFSATGITPDDTVLTTRQQEAETLSKANIMTPYQYFTYGSIQGIKDVYGSKGLLVREAMENGGTYDAYVDAYAKGRISQMSLLSSTAAKMTEEDFQYEYNKLVSGQTQATEEKSEDAARQSFLDSLQTNTDALNTANSAGISGDQLYSVLDTDSDKDDNGKAITYTQDIKARQKAIDNGSWGNIVTAVLNGTVTEDQAISLLGISQNVFELSEEAFNTNVNAMNDGTFSGKLADNTSRWYHVATQKYSTALEQRNKLVQNGKWAKLMEQVNNGTLTEKQAISLSGVNKKVFELSDDAFNVNYSALQEGSYNGSLAGSTGSSSSKSSSSSTSSASKKKIAAINKETKSIEAAAKKQQSAQNALFSKYVTSSNSSSKKIKSSAAVSDSDLALYNSIMNTHNKNINSLKSKYKI